VNARFIACLILALAYGAWRMMPHINIPMPLPSPPSVTVPFSAIGQLAQKLPQSEREAVAEGYMILSRSVQSDPPADPVFLDTDAVRRAHRAALLCVWKGVLDNRTGEVPGLREALESAVNDRIGAADIPMNPALREQAAKAFSDIAASFR
jgi:hypothetical protein